MNHPQIRVAQVLLSAALLKIQDLLVRLDEAPGVHCKEEASCALKACELAEEAIRQVKTPLRRLVRQK